jgi:serine/threonine-protein kinase
MYRLKLLGSLSLEGPSGPLSGRVVQRKRLALLALLAAARDKGMSREKLLGYLWPESDEERASHILSVALHAFKKGLGDEAVVAPGEVLRLNPELVWTDVHELEDALERGEPGAAVKVYGGPFLDGFYLGGAPEFEHWVEGERERYAGLYARALEALALEAEDAGDYGEAAEWRKRLAAQDPYDSRLVVRVMEALAAAGDVANALQQARVHELLLREELGVEPSAEVQETAERLKTQRVPAGAPPSEAREPGVAEAPTLAPGAQGERPPRWRKLALAAVGAVVLLGVLVGGWLLLGRSEPDEPEPVMVVVLPFENLGASEDGYLAHGITDALNVNLSGIHDLGVISRTSAYAIEGSGKTAGEIGSELGVRYILEGTVQRERPGDLTSRVRINPQLVRVADDTHLWAESYDVQMAEVFNVYSDIAESVARALEITLLEEERLALQGWPTENLEAYDHYLRSREYWLLSERDLRIAVRLLERAVELDPEFALGHATLSRAHLAYFLERGDRTQERLAAARDALERALQVDSQLPEVRLALGVYYYKALGDWDRALEEMRAVEKDLAGRERVYSWLGLTHRRRGEWNDAVSYMRKAVRHDPLDVSGWISLGTTYVDLKQYPEADDCFDRALAIRPDAGGAYRWKSWMYVVWHGDKERVREIFDEERIMMGSDPFSRRSGMRFLDRAQYRILREYYEKQVLEGEGYDHLLRGLAYRLAGDVERSRAYHDSARAVWEVRVESSPEGWSRWNYHIALAFAYAGLGRAVEAVQNAETGVRLLGTEWANRASAVAGLTEVYVLVGEYDRALDQIEWSLSNPGKFITPMELRIDPLWDPLREHPRFQALLEEYE